MLAMIEPNRILYRGVRMIEGWPDKIQAASKSLVIHTAWEARISC